MTWQSRARAAIVCALSAAVVAIAPAAASADPQWQRLTDPPGGDAFALVSGAPTVAYAASSGVRVARPAPGGDTWQFVGSPIRHTAGSQVFDPSIAQAPDGRVWITWTELDSAGIRQARVARLDGASWHEVVGGARPINLNIDPRSGPSSAHDPQLGFLDGTPYVAYLQDNPSETSVGVVRLKADGSAWERVDPPAGADARPRIASSGGRLYVATNDRLGPSANVVRLKADKTGWEKLSSPNLPDHASFGDMADVAGAPAVLFAAVETHALSASSLGSGDAWGPIGGGPIATAQSQAFSPQSLTALQAVPYAAWLQGQSAPHAVEVALFASGAWSQLPSPSSAGADATLARLAAGSSGVYLMWAESAAGTTATHVARLSEPVQPPPGAGGGNGTGDTGGGDEGAPSSPPEPGPAANGACSHLVAGSPRGEVLKGTRGGDSISGDAGNDRLFGWAGDDCLFGDAGNDRLWGGHGADRLVGGPGRDELTGGTEADALVGGPGADELHGASGNDSLDGNAGNDVIFAGPGQDEIDAGRGNDHIDVRGGGSDLVACGPGRDVVLLDRDDATRGCEKVIVRR